MNTEQEQLEALQKWWRENGKSVVVGLVVGLGGVFGWTSWKNHTERRAEQASVQYEQLVNTAARDEHPSALAQAEALLAEFPRSGYAPLAALVAARSAFLESRPDDARRHLEWVIEHADRPEIRDVARLRLARVRLDGGDDAAAMRALDAMETSSFDSLRQEVTGDALLARGEREAARTAYDAALADADLTPASRARLRMKLDDLGPTGVGES